MNEAPQGSPSAPELERCLDAWLASKGLDRFGHPEGTMYAGGTPLFDERTGTQRSRATYVLERHPEAARACAETR